MSSLSNAETALLGLLSEKDRYPYQIEQEVQQRSMSYWTNLSLSGIYKTLRKLEKYGFVSSQVEISAENRTRKIYKLTEDGSEALKESVRSILSEPEHLKWRIDLGVNNLIVIGKKEASECMASYIEKLKELVKGYGDLEHYLIGQDCPDFRMALAKRPQRVLGAELEWAKEYLAELEKADD